MWRVCADPRVVMLFSVSGAVRVASIRVFLGMRVLVCRCVTIRVWFCLGRCPCVCVCLVYVYVCMCYLCVCLCMCV